MGALHGDIDAAWVTIAMERKVNRAIMKIRDKGKHRKSDEAYVCCCVTTSPVCAVVVVVCGRAHVVWCAGGFRAATRVYFCARSSRRSARHGEDRFARCVSTTRMRMTAKQAVFALVWRVPTNCSDVVRRTAGLGGQ